MSEKVRFLKSFGDSTQEYSEVINSTYFSFGNGYNVSTKKVFFMEQIHSDNVVVVDKLTGSLETNIISQCDALITSLVNVFLCVKTADCYPIIIYDNVKDIVAIAHSGREGTKKKILEKVLKIMFDKYHCLAQDIFIEIGPGICERNYQVSAEIAKDFYSEFKQINEFSEFLDLKKAIIETANDNNIDDKNILFSDICTYDDERYFSYRRNQTKNRQISIIGMVYV